MHESSGDWILYFATNAELERFISALEMLWDYQNQEVILYYYIKVLIRNVSIELNNTLMPVNTKRNNIMSSTKVLLYKFNEEFQLFICYSIIV